MKKFLLIAGTAFALLALAHLARIVLEGAHLLREPVFVLTTVISIGLCTWALRLLRRT